MKDLSKVARLLTKMTPKNATVDWHRPTEGQRLTFEKSKARMVSPPVLSLSRLDKPYVIDSDASAYQLGCTLLQEQDELGTGSLLATDLTR